MIGHGAINLGDYSHFQPVGYLDEPRVVKRGGHPDLLSEKSGQIGIFCIKVLRVDLEDGAFGGERQKMACRKVREGNRYLTWLSLWPKI